MGSNKEDAYCTLLLTNEYLPGALVLARSLRDAGTTKKLAVLVTMDTLNASTISELNSVYDYIIPVERIHNRAPANLYLMNRPDLHSAFTKIALWRMLQFRKIVYIDADVVVLRAPDELFDLGSSFAAAPDIGWPDCFNSGVLVLNPNMGDYYALLALAQRGISFDGADQGLLNMHFTQWDKISFRYNVTPSGHYQYVPAYRHFQSGISMVHFIGPEKPWQQGREPKAGRTGPYEEMVGRWWAVYDRHYRALPTTAHISGQTSATPSNVHQYVRDDPPQPQDYGYSSVPSTAPIYPDQHPLGSAVEEPVSEAADTLQNFETANVPPVEVETERRFSAPMMEWNPAVAPPPAQSRPEASNFPHEQYTMSESRDLFRPPPSYPEPPKNMWYEVPPKAEPVEKPKPLFPWEENTAKPTRVFAEDKPPSPTPVEEHSPETVSEPEPITPATPTFTITPADPWQTYTRTNAWDDVPQIERYITSLQSRRKGRTQILQAPTPTTEEVLSPGATAGGGRRPSMKLTDFPTEVERPSLPVTPAPRRRSSFWGEDREDLPQAEGVPAQEDWDPLRKLEELTRRQSEILPKVLSPPIESESKELPERKMPESAAPMPAAPVAPDVLGVPNSGAASPHGILGNVLPIQNTTSPNHPSGEKASTEDEAPGFRYLNFGEGHVESATEPGLEDEGVLSPTAV